MINDTVKIFETYVGNPAKHSETNLANPEERKEIEIGEKIIRHCDAVLGARKDLGQPTNNEFFLQIKVLARQLVAMHDAVESSK